MIEFISKKMVIILAVFILISLCAQTSLAVDNLSLTGFIKSIDNNNGILTVNITSESCKGLRVFKVPDGAKGTLDISLIDKKVQFYINSANCEPGKVYNILFERQP
jgi:hypothetical protein